MPRTRFSSHVLAEERELTQLKEIPTAMLAISLRHNELMVKSVEGVYRNGKVELMEPILEAEGSSVIVTWVQPVQAIDLRDRGIDEAQAADLRRRLGTFTEDWDSPEMNAYDLLPPR